ncbi:AbrB/MazE/SpoVT family DNA-binding domain-containing protein [Sphingomonas sp. RP10(2022)]|uniref:AbrB/MazE/SpoVT family DNA-binding domain-containing protein n=2 Tax=Sphingomonas liriopis TaxID=2949094 RepID=A0A9X2HX41_9SPHN|nr:AbrB/MazE/SpoVT family DNA-binding domain-containing protein [Sphingomonas liriopis]
MAKPDMTQDERVQAIDHAYGSMPWLKSRERKRVSVKVFKSGNSMALRLPASLGLQAGSEIELEIEDDAHVSFDLPDKPKRKIDVARFWGTLPDLTPIPDEDRLFAPRDDSDR